MIIWYNVPEPGQFQPRSGILLHAHMRECIWCSDPYIRYTIYLIHISKSKPFKIFQFLEFGSLVLAVSDLLGYEAIHIYIYIYIYMGCSVPNRISPSIKYILSHTSFSYQSHKESLLISFKFGSFMPVSSPWFTYQANPLHAALGPASSHNRRVSQFTNLMWPTRSI